ncbi:putative DD34D transposase [Trichonephila clavipes]|nr:putative DD34D transposase [Trichonephila clavipes]
MLDVWVQHQLTPKNMMDRISIYEALAKRNEIDPFLKRMVTGDEKWVTYDNIVRKRLWSKRGEVAQTVAKPGLTSRKRLEEMLTSEERITIISWILGGKTYEEMLQLSAGKQPPKGPISGYLCTNSAPPYGVRGTEKELISVAQAYCLKESMELKRRRGAPSADPLRSLIKDYWGRERGPPRWFKGFARNLTRIFFIFLHHRISPPPHHSSLKTRDRDCGAAASQGEKNWDGLLKTE